MKDKRLFPCKNPPSIWHKEKIRVAKVTYDKSKKDKNYYQGYFAAHQKFIELESKGIEPDYSKYRELFMKRYYEAKDDKTISFYAGARLAAIESRTGMTGNKYKNDLRKWKGVK